MAGTGNIWQMLELPELLELLELLELGVSGPEQDWRCIWVIAWDSRPAL